MARVIRLFGKADSFDIEFSRRGEKWEVDIPPDMTDGVYAVQLTAVDGLGETAYWVGELFMCSGVCHLKIERRRKKCLLSAESYGLKASPKHRTGISRQKYELCFSENLRMLFSAEARKHRRLLFSVSDSVSFSESADMCLAVKGLRLTGSEKRMLTGCEHTASIRKECGHV